MINEKPGSSVAGTVHNISTIAAAAGEAGQEAAAGPAVWVFIGVCTLGSLALMLRGFSDAKGAIDNREAAAADREQREAQRQALIKKMWDRL